MCTCIHGAQILGVVMQSSKKRPRLERAEGRQQHISASAVQPAIPADPLLELQQIWTIRPSHHQPPSTDFELTHKRPVPLPFAIDLVINGKTHACLYSGHGQSKVVYRVLKASADEPQVLKLTATMDQEPYVCQQLSSDCSAAQPALKICPTIYSIGRCQEQDEWGKPRGKWFAWLAEYATPLDQYIQDPTVDRQACFKMALYQQVRAGQHGLLLSDNNLINFGVNEDTVVIIDIGSRRLKRDAIPKGTMNTSAIHGWWKKLVWHCRPGELDECRAIWQQCHSLDEVAQQLCNTRLRPLSTVPVIDSAEQPAAAITQAPSVWALLEEQWLLDDNGCNDEATDDVQWLLEDFLWGNLASLKLLRTGETIPLEQAEPQPPHIRLETVFKLTEQRRSKWIQRPNDILSEETLKSLLDEWKADYKTWMNQTSQDEWYRTRPPKRRGFERTRFRNFLFKMCGCYDLVIFWLRVPASWPSLHIFRETFEMTATSFCAYSESRIRMNQAVEAFRDAYGR